jgi:hypothetical protein
MNEQFIDRIEGRRWACEVLGALRNSTESCRAGFWLRIKQELTRQGLTAKELHQSQDSRSGMAAIIGKWPGDETDGEIREALNETDEQSCHNCEHTKECSLWLRCQECLAITKKPKRVAKSD